MGVLRRQAHEDQEFHHMEEQVGWEAEKEESLRVICQLERRIANTRYGLRTAARGRALSCGAGGGW